MTGVLAGLTFPHLEYNPIPLLLPRAHDAEGREPQPSPETPGAAGGAPGGAAFGRKASQTCPLQNARASRDGLATRSRQARGRTSRKGSSQGCLASTLAPPGAPSPHGEKEKGMRAHPGAPEKPSPGVAERWLMQERMANREWTTEPFPYSLFATRHSLLVRHRPSSDWPSAMTRHRPA